MKLRIYTLIIWLAISISNTFGQKDSCEFVMYNEDTFHGNYECVDELMVNDISKSELLKFKNLKKLYIHGTENTEQILDHAWKLDSLETLYLQNVNYDLNRNIYKFVNIKVLAIEFGEFDWIIRFMLTPKKRTKN